MKILTYIQTGSINGGNTFPGVARPLGIVKLGPDLYTGTDAYSGYLPTGNFTGFTMLHESGTGGAPKYGVVSQMPVVGSLDNPLSDAINDTRASKDFTEVGYYRASLGSGTVLEMAATNKAGLYKYEFPKQNASRHVLVDVSHVLSSYRGQGLEQHFLGGNISVSQDDDENFYYTGFGTYDNVSEIVAKTHIYGDIDWLKGLEPSCPLDRLLLRIFRFPVHLQDVPGPGLRYGRTGRILRRAILRV